MWSLVLLFAAVGLTYFAVCVRLFGRLRQLHPATWQQLGRPSAVDDGLSFRVLLFAATGRHKSLQDPSLDRLFTLAKLAFVLLNGGILAVMGALLLQEVAP